MNAEWNLPLMISISLVSISEIRFQKWNEMKSECYYNSNFIAIKTHTKIPLLVPIIFQEYNCLKWSMHSYELSWRIHAGFIPIPVWFLEFRECFGALNLNSEIKTNRNGIEITRIEFILPLVYYGLSFRMSWN